MKKKELIERIAEEAEVPKSEAQKYCEAFEEVVTEAVTKPGLCQVRSKTESPCPRSAEVEI